MYVISFSFFIFLHDSYFSINLLPIDPLYTIVFLTFVLYLYLYLYLSLSMTVILSFSILIHECNIFSLFFFFPHRPRPHIYLNVPPKLTWEKLTLSFFSVFIPESETRFLYIYHDYFLFFFSLPSFLFFCHPFTDPRFLSILFYIVFFSLSISMRHW